MNETEHFLSCLAEEGCETGQRVSKALRFGLKQTQHGHHMNNAERITEEAKDFIAVAHILYEEGVIPFPYPTQAEIDAKRARIVKLMAVGREHGVLA
jgi:hypothetical protein